MKQITKKAYAKINLSLDVLSKRPDGYHEVCMVMHQIDLCDQVTISIDTDPFRNNIHLEPSPTAHSISLTTNNGLIPTDGGNIAYKAAKAMMDLYTGKDKLEVKIHIEKNIPVSAGLAGGSTNAAAVLLAMDELLELNIPRQKLLDIGKSLGADVPFCIIGGCALSEGIGEKLTPLEGIELEFLLSKPSIEVSTAKVYGGLNIPEIQNHPNTKELLIDLKQKNIEKMYKNMKNVLENVTLKEYDIVMYTKNKMENLGAEHALMSGSGPSVFAFYPDRDKLECAYTEMKKINNETFMVKTFV